MTDKLLVPIDLAQEKAMDLVFPNAVDMARHRAADVLLLTVLPDMTSGMFPYVPHQTMKDAQAEAQKRIEEVGKARMPDDVAWEGKAVVGPVASTIAKQAKEVGASMIVMASHNPKTVDILLGSVADQVIRRAHCSVLVVRDPGRESKS